MRVKQHYTGVAINCEEDDIPMFIEAMELLYGAVEAGESVWPEGRVQHALEALRTPPD